MDKDEINKLLNRDSNIKNLDKFVSNTHSSILNIAYKTSKNNPYKECDLWMGKTPKSWRSAKTEFGEVNTNVLLYLDTEKLNISYSNSYEDGGSIMPKALDGLMNKVSDMIDAAAVRGNTNQLATRIAELDNPKIWTKTSPIKLGGDLVFKFWFGSAGLYDAFEEVVKPMCVLGSLFAPKRSADGVLTPPLPSKAYWTGVFLSEALESIKGVAGFVNKTSELEDEIQMKEDELNDKKALLEAYEDGSYASEINAANTATIQQSSRYEAVAATGDGAALNVLNGMTGTIDTKSINTKKDALQKEINALEEALYGTPGAQGESKGGLKAELKRIKDAEKRRDKAEKESFGQDLVKAAVDAQSAYFKAIHAGAYTIANSGSYDGWAIAKIRIGNFVLGPLTATGAKFSFDTKLLDNNGYPCQGTLTLPGIEFYRTATDKSLIDTISPMLSKEGSDQTSNDFALDATSIAEDIK